MTQLKRCFLDWRSPSPTVWTKARRAALKDYDMRSVSSAWDRDPAGEAPGITLVAQATCLYTYDGRPGRPWMQEAIDNRWHVVFGEPRVVWQSADGKGKLLMLNLADHKCASWLGARMAEEYGWADGWHRDYSTLFSYMFAFSDPGTYWKDYAAGLHLMAQVYESIRPQAILISQQYAWRPYLEGSAGLFLEQGPRIFGRTPAQHAGEMRDQKLTHQVVELQPVSRYTTAQIAEAEAFCKDPGAFLPTPAPGSIAPAYLSMGRDAKAWAS